MHSSGISKEQLIIALKDYDLDTMPATHLGDVSGKRDNSQDTIKPPIGIGYYHRRDGVIERQGNGFEPLQTLGVADHFYSEIDRLLDKSPPSAVIPHKKGWYLSSQPLGENQGELIIICPVWTMDK